MPRRCVGYVRISALMGREQGNDLLSDEIQREKIEAWAKYRDFQIVGWYTDLDVSGRQGVRRPEFERMMADAAAGKFEAVVVYRLTRFARSTAAAAAAFAELRKHDVALVSTTEDIDTTSASGMFMQNILFAMAEFESERISEEWKNVHANRRARGIANVNGPVTGYRTVNGRIVEIDQATAAAVRKIYAMRAQGLGYGQIRRALANEGFTTATGASLFSQGTLSRILRNPIYVGKLRLANGELVDGEHDAIVPAELWDQVQAIAAPAARMNRHHGSLLSGLPVCGSCGYRMHFDRARPGRPQGDVYRCSARRRSEPCPKPVSIDAAMLDDYIERLFLRRLDPRRSRIKAPRQQREWQARGARARARVDEMNRALDGLADQRYVKGTMSAVEYDRQAARFLEQRAESEAQAQDIERMIAVVRPLERDVISLWPQLTIDAKRRAIRVAIGEIKVNPAIRRGPGQAKLLPERLVVSWLQ